MPSSRKRVVFNLPRNCCLREEVKSASRKAATTKSTFPVLNVLLPGNVFLARDTSSGYRQKATRPAVSASLTMGASQLRFATKFPACHHHRHPPAHEIGKQATALTEKRPFLLASQISTGFLPLLPLYHNSTVADCATSNTFK